MNQRNAIVLRRHARATASPSSVQVPSQQLASSVAQQMVAQATGMAVQDATAYLQGVSVVAGAAIAYSIAQMIAEETTKPWSDIIKACNSSVTEAASTFKTIGSDASDVLKDFGGG